MKKFSLFLILFFICIGIKSNSFGVGHAQLNFGAAVATSSPEATQVALDILKSGGNAVDAACAAVFALNVTQPHFTGIGGGGFALIHQKGKKDVFLDFRESAPASVTSRQFYKNGENEIIPDWAERNTGAKAVGVPGVVAGCGQAVRENGKLSWNKILQPAVVLARKGFVVSQWFQEELAEQWSRISPFGFTKLLLQGPSGNGLKRGEHFNQPKLAQTLEDLAKNGPNSFYFGEFAKKWLGEAHTFGIEISEEDLAKYQVFAREVVPFDFAQFHGVTVSAPSGAGLMLAAQLRYLDHYYLTHSLKSLSPLERSIVTVEAKSFFAKMRKDFIADPSRMNFREIYFLNSAAEKSAWQELDKHIATRVSKLTIPHLDHVPAVAGSGLTPIETHTAHVSVVDQFGNAVALTSSVGNIYGSGIILPESGFVLNSTLGDFNPEENLLNSPAPLVRPLSNMSPLFLYEKNPTDENLIGIMGAAGGRLIPSGILDFVQNYYLDHRSKDESIRSPRIHSDDGIHVYIEKHASFDTHKLGEIGYQIEPVDNVWAVFEGVVRRASKDKWEAVSDSRYDGLGETF